MKARGKKSARVKHGARGPGCQTGSCSLLALPVEVLHQVLDLLDPHDLLKLLHTSKAMAAEVMQHSAGRLTFKVQPCTRAKMAAIRQLQWAPPSTLKLKLDGLPGIPATLPATIKFMLFSSPASHDWDSLMRATHAALPALSSHAGQHSLQLPCFSEAYIQGFVLPGLVPAGLTDLCPNLHTLHLRHCAIQDGEGARNSKAHSHSSRISTSTSTSTGAHASTGVPIPTHLRTLDLQYVSAPCLKVAAAGSSRATTSNARVTRSNTRVTRSLQAARQYREQLRSCLPNLTCLTLSGSSIADQMISMFGPQLTELRFEDYLPTSDIQWWQANTGLQQLQKLVLPSIHAAEADIKKLLSLPSLTQLELHSVQRRFQEDYSSHPCKWQTLHLYGRVQHINTLAMLPLHSLVQPLKLGCDSGEGVQLWLPPATVDDSYHDRLDLMAQRLGKCGVQVLEPHGSWFCVGPGDLDSQLNEFAQGSECVHAMITIGPVFGLHARVSLVNLVVDQPILEAVATVYGASLQQLVLEECAFEDDMLPAWHAALSGLPAVRKLELVECCYDSHHGWDDTPKIADLLRKLAEAMAQQPEGRCIEVMLADACGYGYFSSTYLADLVLNGADGLDGAGALLMGLEVTPQNRAKDNDSAYDDDDDASCVCITSKHRS